MNLQARILDLESKLRIKDHELAQIKRRMVELSEDREDCIRIGARAMDRVSRLLEDIKKKAETIRRHEETILRQSKLLTQRELA